MVGHEGGLERRVERVATCESRDIGLPRPCRSSWSIEPGRALVGRHRLGRVDAARAHVVGAIGRRQPLRRGRQHQALPHRLEHRLEHCLGAPRLDIGEVARQRRQAGLDQAEDGGGVVLEGERDQVGERRIGHRRMQVHDRGATDDEREGRCLRRLVVGDAVADGSTRALVAAGHAHRDVGQRAVDEELPVGPGEGRVGRRLEVQAERRAHHVHVVRGVEKGLLVGIEDGAAQHRVDVLRAQGHDAGHYREVERVLGARRARRVTARQHLELRARHFRQAEQVAIDVSASKTLSCEG